ncbi:E3 ubiquitin-protein ligase SH3RF2 [Cololabis saira]|uniref:E3 ubiquitin-protein ligase SH3RF2 n=1 Tax=Cololabis saira TaxID=129043 RepID=UPI002AD38792|nr:E3 ubiquitin-protein ligase SH3RF2 [Cololabis saira]XP_061581079.1 E3 ubiquitin-protein ligase SH3RF2 [Cololabis saira]
MVDYTITDVPGTLDSKTRGPCKMEELTVMALLECPLCLEQLDATAKVLPCQHTFCVSCLQQREAAQPQLLCPECGVPAAARTAAELPQNLLLVQLLGGLQGREAQRVHQPAPLARVTLTARDGQQRESQHRDKQGLNEVAPRTSAYKQQSEISRELSSSIPPNHKVEDNWHSEDTGNNSRASVDALQAFSQASQLQHLHQAQALPLCKALRDFDPEEMNRDDSKYCLSFLKGDILTVIRRVDEHWIEAKRGEKVGICPLQFTEPYSAAAKLLKGKSRRGGDSAESPHQAGSGGKDKATDTSSRTAHYGAPWVPAKTAPLSASPLSIQQKQSKVGGSNNFYQSHAYHYTSEHRGQTQRVSLPSAARSNSYPSRVNPLRLSHHSEHHRRHSQSERKMTSETPPTISMALINPQVPSASADGRNSSTQQLSISVCAVLYSYKPRRPEELELRKGEMVGVYGKFKEGWLRGLSLRTGKVGILPSNYITPVLRTSARLLETKATNPSSQYHTAAGKKPTVSKNPAVVLALDRVNGDGAIYSTGQLQSVPSGAQHAMSSTASVKPSFYGSSQGWDTVRRIFNPHRGSNHSSQLSNFSIPSNSQHFAQVQASGYSPALQRKKNSSILNSKPLGWMTEPAAPSAAAVMNLTSSHEPFQHQRHHTNIPQSILVKPDTHKNNTDKLPKSVRFLSAEESPPPRHRTSSWSSGTQVLPNCRPGPPLLEVWAPSLTLGRDGPGIILKEGKSPILRTGLETANPNSNPQKPPPSHPPLSALSAQFSPSRHRVITTHLAQTDSELCLLHGEMVLVHRPRADGRVLITQESSGQTGLFNSTILQALERLS